MIEILRILISIIGMASVNNGAGESVNMLSFNGKAESAYFVGETLPGGVDRQHYGGNGQQGISARYMLEGTDFEGQQCKIYIENNKEDDPVYLHPYIVTDSKALAFLSNPNLKSKLDMSNGGLTIRIYCPLDQVPDEVRRPAQQQGRIEEFHYTAKMGGKKLTKRAQVYLPYGYAPQDKTKKYNVLYLMHGGGDNTTSFLTPPNNWFALRDVLDHLIAQGKMDPIIVVTPTFYRDDQNIGANRMDDATKQCCDFNQELRQYLIPTVEKAYNTHYTGKGKTAIEDSRDHRAFGGFSMGALCTWFQLASDVAAVSRFIPLSGNLWVDGEDGQRLSDEDAAKWLNDRLEKSPYKNDFRVFGYSGTKDIAGSKEQALVDALYTDACPLFSAKNLEFGMKQDGEHFYGHINEYLYHALPRLWTKE